MIGSIRLAVPGLALLALFAAPAAAYQLPPVNLAASSTARRRPARGFTSASTCSTTPPTASRTAPATPSPGWAGWTSQS